ncbi:MAG: protein jag [Vicinamibacterales bacterium]
MSTSLETKVVDFVRQVVGAMGLSLDAEVERSGDGVRVNLQGEGGSALLVRRAEPLQALQHLVDTIFRDEMEKSSRVLLDCMGFRRDKDLELRQMAKFLVDKAKSTGVEQQIGPLNAYERRIVHLVVNEDPAVASESIGDAAQKTVIISKRKS